MYFGVDPEFVNYQLGPFCAASATSSLFDIGYRKTYSIIYNPPSLKLNLALGGKVITKIRDEF
jgi:hypothetical protein